MIFITFEEFLKHFLQKSWIIKALAKFALYLLAILNHTLKHFWRF